MSLEVITKSHLRHHDIQGRVKLSKIACKAYEVRRGDFVFNRTSETQEEIGLASVYTSDEPVVFGGFVIRGRSTTDRLYTTYAGYGLRSPIVRAQIIARGQGAVRANIGQFDLRQIWIPLPPKAEQEAIATILSDMDAEIVALEAKLAKARQLKQSMMQELLTGKTRLVESAK
jgi:type I restriction enzyme, S subunit